MVLQESYPREKAASGCTSSMTDNNKETAAKKLLSFREIRPSQHSHSMSITLHHETLSSLLLPTPGVFPVVGGPWGGRGEQQPTGKLPQEKEQCNNQSQGESSTVLAQEQNPSGGVCGEDQGVSLLQELTD
ncbi:unnamed protein product [Lepidochelys kempii]